MPDPRLPERLQLLLAPVPFSGCWLYVGTRLSRNGYARVWWEGRELQLHRVVWEILVGRIPAGLILDHLPVCRCRACSNPAHLEPVTVRENTLRGEAVLFGMRPLVNA